ncbi:MAG: lipocalin family protein [Bacteriovoracaceae bacterium]
MKLLILSCFILSFSCSSMEYTKTVDYVNLDKFFGKWFVIAGRLTLFEKGAHNAVEEYKWNENKDRIDVSFTYNKNSFDGKLKSIPQKGWVYNHNTNAHWKIRPFWPLKLDYLIIDLAKDYSWTVVGVPNQKYVWIMSKQWKMNDKTLSLIIQRLDKLGYRIDKIKRVPQKW